MEQEVIRPQDGPQSDFLSSSADIVIYGGSAGSGKSFALLMEPLRWITTVPGFGGVIFRRTSPQIRNEGGLWDTSQKLYPKVEGRPKESLTEWAFPLTGELFPNTLKFASIQYEANKYDYDGSQIPFIGFDELIHFTETQFWYLLTRNRSVCGVRPYVRCTTNPDPDSWVLELIKWWIDTDEESENYGYAIPERSGVIRWFVRLNDEMHWADSEAELLEQFSHLPREMVQPKSLTFISAKLSDNQILMQQDPGYLANLLAQPRVERLRLLGEGNRGGNWMISGKAGDYFRRDWFPLVEAAPRQVIGRVRYWDLAGTQDGGDWTVGTLMSKTAEGIYTIEHVTRAQLSPGKVERLILRTAAHDASEYGAVTTWIERDPGQAGKAEGHYFTKLLDGHDVRITPVPRHSKIDRAKLYSAQVEAGNVHLVRNSAWNKQFLLEHEQFPEGTFDDQVDSASGAWRSLYQLRPKRRAARTQSTGIFDHLEVEHGNPRGRRRRRA